MKQRDIFRLVLKTGGLFNLWRAVGSYFEAILLSQGLARTQSVTPRYSLLWGVYYSVVGLYLFLGGRLLLDLAFPEEKEVLDSRTENDKDPHQPDEPNADTTPRRLS